MNIEELRAKLNGTTETEKPHQKREQKESKLQIACVRWFRLQYPAFAKLLYHPKNEADGAATGKKIAINAAMGVVPGVPDLVLALPSYKNSEDHEVYFSLGIELKFGKTNNPSINQKNFRMYWEQAGFKYSLCRSIEDFMAAVKEYMATVPSQVYDGIVALHCLDPDTENNRKLLDKIIKSKK